MCTHVMCVVMVDIFYICHEIVNMLIFSHLLTNVYMSNWTTLSVVLVALHDAWNDSGS